MNAVLAIIPDGGRAIVVIYTEGEEINYFSFILLILIKKPLRVASSNPFHVGSQGWGMFPHQKHCAGWGNGSVLCHGGDVCVLVFS